MNQSWAKYIKVNGKLIEHDAVKNAFSKVMGRRRKKGITTDNEVPTLELEVEYELCYSKSVKRNF